MFDLVLPTSREFRTYMRKSSLPLSRVSVESMCHLQLKLSSFFYFRFHSLFLQHIKPLGLILEWKMMMNWKGYGKNRSCRYFGHYPDICEETEKARENVSKTGILAEI